MKLRSGSPRTTEATPVRWRKYRPSCPTNYTGHFFSSPTRVPSGTEAATLPLMPERPCHLVGASQSAGLTYHIRVSGPASVAGRISVGARVGYRHDHSAIPVNVDVS